MTYLCKRELRGLNENNYFSWNNNELIDFFLDVLTPLSAIFQLYHGDLT
jgi:hypothetical protein